MTMLAEQCDVVVGVDTLVEVERPVRPTRRNGKADALDAIRAARDVLAREQQIEPRAEGDREAIRVLSETRQGAVVARTQAISQLRALVVTAPEPLRARLAGLPSGALLDRCARMRTSAAMTAEHEATVVAFARRETAPVSSHRPNRDL